MIMGDNVNKKILYSFAIITFFILSSFASQGLNISSSNNSDKFFLWAISDTHGQKLWDDAVSFDGTHWSGDLIKEGVSRIDYAFIAGDVSLMGGHSDYFSEYLNETCSNIMPNRKMDNFWSTPADERKWGFAIGNHEEYGGGCTEAAKGLGLDPSENWYNNEIVMGKSYNYTALRGNLLFIYMGGDRSTPNSYNYGLSNPGDFYWLEDKVEWADENGVNVIIVTHTSIFNGSNSYTFPLGHSNHDMYYDVDEECWKKCEEHTRYVCDFEDPWPGENIWSKCNSYWNLINSYGNVNLWFNGHTHTAADSRGPPPHKHAGWDTTHGVERNIQKGKYCTFVNLGAIFAWGWPWSYSRILIFEQGSTNVDFKSYDHMEDKYGHDTGWKSSHQDITITDCLKYPFDKYYDPSNNEPDIPEKPGGEKNGKTGDEYEYSTSTTDPEGDQIYYLFNWNDETDSGWLGPYNSGETCYASHSWSHDGTYIVRAKAKDEHGAETGWSEPLNVVMPKAYFRLNILRIMLSILRNGL